MLSQQLLPEFGSCIGKKEEVKSSKKAESFDGMNHIESQSQKDKKNAVEKMVALKKTNSTDKQPISTDCQLLYLRQGWSFLKFSIFFGQVTPLSENLPENTGLFFSF